MAVTVPDVIHAPCVTAPFEASFTSQRERDRAGVIAAHATFLGY